MIKSVDAHDRLGVDRMDVEILKKRIKALEEERDSIDIQITEATEKTQRIVNQHNQRTNFLTAEKNKLEGKIDILQELVNAEDPIKPKKGPK